VKERIFIKESIQHLEAKEFIRKKFSNAEISEIDIKRTPVGTRIVIHTTRPGMIIGHAGSNIDSLTKELEKNFDIKNPQIDVQRVNNPDLDAHIIAQKIADAIEKGVNYKRVGNFYISRIMDAGAIGCEIVLSGKFSGERGRVARFLSGYLKKCGDTSDKLVEKAFAVATPKLGNVGVTVSIMLKPIKPILNPAKSDKSDVKSEPVKPAEQEAATEKAGEAKENSSGEEKSEKIEKKSKESKPNKKKAQTEKKK